MRLRALQTVSAFGALALAVIMTTACNAAFCDIVECAAGGGGSGGAGTGGSTTTTDGGGGTGGGLPDNCLPKEGVEIADTCGVFVKKGATGNGDKTDPFGSIVEASTSLGDAKAIYVCGNEGFAGSVELPGGVSLIGGLDCNEWTYSASSSRPSIVGDVDVPALTIQGTGISNGSASVVSIDLEAVTATTAGVSSIGILISSATVSIDQSDITAGNGANGGMPPGQVPKASQAPGGSMGANAGGAPANVDGGSHTCGAETLQGGFGGKGGDSSQAVKDGGNGTQGDVDMGGAPGIGQTGSTLNCVAGQGLGGGGLSGDPAGPGAGAMALGTISAAGLAPADGEPGQPGQNGQSGGGGGGSKATTTLNGAGGGGGGAGGCGGLGGAAGEGGGSSIALLSFSAKVTLTSAVVLHVGTGGAGGAGGKAQFGQDGGGPGPGGGSGTGVPAACAGGSGGPGGNGGNGGGGRGGHAIAIAYKGEAPTGGTPDMSAAMAGMHGVGGDNTVPPAGGNGLDGVVAPSQAFP